MNKILIGEMSWTDFQEKMKETDLIIMPVGVLEEHGQHNPLGTDTYIAESAAYEVGKAANLPVAPVLPYGYQKNMGYFAGTISLDPILYRDVLKSYCESFIKCGVKRILFINGHGGNTDLLQMVSGDLFDKYGCLCMYNQWWKVLPQINKEWDCADHGGYFETSVMMAVNGKIIDMTKAKDATDMQLTEKIKYFHVRENSIFLHGWKFNNAEINVPTNIYNLQKIGNLGNSPEGANAKLGREMMEEYVKFNVELTEEMRKIDL